MTEEDRRKLQEASAAQREFNRKRSEDLKRMTNNLVRDWSFSVWPLSKIPEGSEIIAKRFFPEPAILFRLGSDIWYAKSESEIPLGEAED